MITARFKAFGITLGLLSVFTIGAMVASPIGTASAAKMEKVSVCHFQEEVLDAETGDVIENAEWKIINVNGNSLPAHLGDDQHPGHGDGEFIDQLIDDSDEPTEDTVTSADCLARNSSLGG